ncbi:MAG: hypothetical protein U0003_01650 [Vampirovibrionales bacterium]
MKSLKGGRHSVSPAELRKLCREFGAKTAGQRAQFERLGCGRLGTTLLHHGCRL